MNMMSLRSLFMKSRIIKATAILMLLITLVPFSPANALSSCCGVGCGSSCANCANNCTSISEDEMDLTIEHVSDEFTAHREWMVEYFFIEHLLPALMLFTEQITAMAMHQVMMVGTLLDAKHQLETQRLFQQMMAEAHKDYQPSEGMCTFGTGVRALASADRKMDLSAMTFSNRVLQRELLSGDAVAGGGRSSDIKSRLDQYIALYCNRSDNGMGMALACPGAPVQPGRVNNDINYTALLDSPLTIRLDFTPEGNASHAANAHANTVSPEEEDIFALSANLYAHQVAPAIPQAFLTNEDGQANERGVNHYMNIRSIAAKRSVARNSFASIAALKTQGSNEGEPYMYAIMREMGLGDPEVLLYMGDRPSYYAQMEILTKKLYQNPSFYTELYDKPANIKRKTVAMQAIDLMQRRDIYRSLLRSEAIMAVMLETALVEREERIINEIPRLNDDGELVRLP